MNSLESVAPYTIPPIPSFSLFLPFLSSFSSFLSKMAATTTIAMTSDERATVAKQINALTALLRALEQKLDNDNVLQRKEAEQKAEEVREKRYRATVVPLEDAVAATRTPPFPSRESASAYARAEYDLAAATGGWTRSIRSECGGHRSYTEFKDTLFARVYSTGFVAIPYKYCKFNTDSLSVICIADKEYIVL